MDNVIKSTINDLWVMYSTCGNNKQAKRIVKEIKKYQKKLLTNRRKYDII